MKLLSTLIFILIVLLGNSFAQPVVTSSSFPQSGIILKYSIGSAVSPMVLKTGSDVTWDFSKINFESASEIEYCDPNLSKEGGKFPEANMAYHAKPSMTDYTFLRIDKDLVSYHGFVAALENYIYEAIYDDPWTWYKLPVKYQDKFSDSYAVNTTMKLKGETIDYHLMGEYSYRVDGFGTVITPFKRIPNVLRITADIYENDSTVFRSHQDSTSLRRSHVQKISWISSEPGNYFEIVSTFDSKDFFLAETMNTTVLSVPESGGMKQEMMIYPDPVTNKLNVELTNVANTHFDLIIFNSLGNIVKRYEVDKTGNEFFQWNTNVADLAPGMYHIQLRNEKNQWNGSFFKQ